MRKRDVFSLPMLDTDCCRGILAKKVQVTRIHKKPGKVNEEKNQIQIKLADHL